MQSLHTCTNADLSNVPCTAGERSLCLPSLGKDKKEPQKSYFQLTMCVHIRGTRRRKVERVRVRLKGLQGPLVKVDLLPWMRYLVGFSNGIFGFGLVWIKNVCHQQHTGRLKSGIRTHTQGFW